MFLIVFLSAERRPAAARQVAQGRSAGDVGRPVSFQLRFHVLPGVDAVRRLRGRRRRLVPGRLGRAAVRAPTRRHADRHRFVGRRLRPGRFARRLHQGGFVPTSWRTS